MASTSTDPPLPDSSKSGFRPRKRMRNLEAHKENKRKALVQRGEEHITKSKRTIPKKQFEAQTVCKCKRDCSKKINIQRQEELFNDFYRFVNWSRKTLFLRSLVETINPKENLNPIKQIKKKKVSNMYHLSDSSGISHRVCLPFLLTCLQITKSLLFNAINSRLSNPNAIERRGTFPNRKTNHEDYSYLHSFIKRFPTHQSHYGKSKSKSNIKYLNPCLNVRRMYREYCLVSELERPKKKVLRESFFRHVFNTQFNLRFKPPKVDTCKTCDRLDILIASSSGDNYERYSKEKKDHDSIKEKNEIRFQNAILKAKNSNGKIEIRTFDLQRALEIPHLTTSVAFYKRQLWVYNLCIYDEVRNVGYMYVWPESTASRGAQEIAACIVRHLRETLSEETEELILKSDSCFGQNKNIKLSLILKQFLDSWPYKLKIIEQWYFVVGHSYNSCDRCFGLIERQKKRTEDIFIPSHWQNIMKQAKKKDPKFVVTEMRTEDFLSSEPLESIIINRKKSTEGDKIKWGDFESIIYHKEKPFILQATKYTNEVDAPIITISLKKRHVVKRLSQVKLPLLYPNGRSIKKEKYDDLQNLLQYIRPEFHPFYINLKYT